MKKKCLECGEEIKGRIDKKFCSDQCRNAYNNRQNSDVNNYVRNINNTLRKNRRILKAFNPNGKAKINRDELVKHDFNFNYFTNIYTTKTGKTYYFCYEQGYLQIEENFFMLVIKKDYVI